MSFTFVATSCIYGFGYIRMCKFLRFDNKYIILLCTHQLVNRQTHALSIVASQDITEIPCWHREAQLYVVLHVRTSGRAGSINTTQHLTTQQHLTR